MHDLCGGSWSPHAAWVLSAKDCTGALYRGSVQVNKITVKKSYASSETPLPTIVKEIFKPQPVLTDPKCVAPI